MLGLVVLAAGLGAAAWMIGAGVDRGWRLALLPVFGFAGLGVFQALGGT